MAMTMHLDVVSAEEELFSGAIEEVVVPGVEGNLGILPRHNQLISNLRPGEVRIKTHDGTHSLFVSGGVLEVQPHVVTVLADTAIRADDLDEEAALKARREAEEALAGKDPEDLDYDTLQAELEAAKAQFEMFQRISKARH